MTALSTTAWLVHDMGLAAGFGGSLLGKYALNHAARSASSREDRGRVMATGWTRFNRVNLAGIGVAAATWLLGRLFLSGRELGRGPRALVVAKDALLAGTLGTAIYEAFGSRRLATASEGGARAPVPAHEARVGEEGLAKAERVLARIGTANLLLAAGVLGVTTVLAQQAGRSHRYGLLSRFLP
jgi:hypothetical protein